jgi:hypothetical protein
MSVHTVIGSGWSCTMTIDAVLLVVALEVDFVNAGKKRRACPSGSRP